MYNPWIRKALLNRDIIEHNFNSSTQEADKVKSLWIRGQPDLPIQFQDRQSNTDKTVLKDKNKKSHCS